MTIFTDPDKSNVDWGRRQLRGVFADNLRTPSLAMEKMVFGKSGFVDQSFAEVFAKAGGMRNRQPDIIVTI
jgi:hypothetical protein